MNVSTTPVVVLLVQPEQDDRDMYSTFLRFKGLVPIPVSTAAEALTLASRADVIVTAIHLSGTNDGVEFIARVKMDERTKDIPVVVLTACSLQSDRDRAVAAGCDVFLPKPCLPDMLVSEIRGVLALKRVPKPKPAAASQPPTPGFRRTS